MSRPLFEANLCAARNGHLDDFSGRFAAADFVTFPPKKATREKANKSTNKAALHPLPLRGKR